ILNFENLSPQENRLQKNFLKRDKKNVSGSNSFTLATANASIGDSMNSDIPGSPSSSKNVTSGMGSVLRQTIRRRFSQTITTRGWKNASSFN
ncbi:MAG TPA: hypothetical protein VGB68_03570, partial [Pyrinomonadaceae bacterium]